MRIVKATLKYLAYGIGAIILYLLAQEYPAISYGLAGAAAFYFLSEMMKNAAREALQDELWKIREQSYKNAETLEAIDRKVSAIWNRIRQISGG